MSNKMNEDELALYLKLVANDTGRVKVKQNRNPRPPSAKTTEEIQANYEAGWARRRLRLAAEEKARVVDTTQGHVPLTLGKYGMTVEEYIEWTKTRRNKK